MSARYFPHILITALAMALGGCATMDQSECLTANWTMIGMEDGAMGRPESYLGNHRKACADYGVSPDLSAYLTGHADGISQYCTERNGFARGRSGSRYNGVCPPALEAPFLNAYDLGRDLYLANRELQEIISTIRSREKQIERTIITRNEKEQLLIHGRISPAERAELLLETKELDRSIGPLEDEILHLDERREEVESRIVDLESLNIYR